MHRRLITRGYNLEPYAFNDSLIAAFWEVTGSEHATLSFPSEGTPFSRIVSFNNARPIRQIAPVSRRSTGVSPVICHYIGVTFSRRRIVLTCPRFRGIILISVNNRRKSIFKFVVCSFRRSFDTCRAQNHAIIVLTDCPFVFDMRWLAMNPNNNSRVI